MELTWIKRFSMTVNCSTAPVCTFVRDEVTSHSHQFVRNFIKPSVSLTLVFALRVQSEAYTETVGNSTATVYKNFLIVARRYPQRTVRHAIDLLFLDPRLLRPKNTVICCLCLPALRYAHCPSVTTIDKQSYRLVQNDQNVWIQLRVRDDRKLQSSLRRHITSAIIRTMIDEYRGPREREATGPHHPCLRERSKRLYVFAALLQCLE